MEDRIRYPVQMQQEQVGRHQLSERLTEFGWRPTVPIPDLGEDFIVDIYLDGRATGVAFYVQAKTITNLQQRRQGNYLVYDGIGVKDLLHWQRFGLPAVLIIWDVQLRQGRWVLVDEAIHDLDRRRPNWRQNKSNARVRIPWTNTTDDAGLRKLQRTIGIRLYPLITKGKEWDFKVEFPQTDAGQSQHRAFELLFGEGGPIVIESQYLHPSQLWRQWFGENLPGSKVILPPKVPSKGHLYRVEFSSPKSEKVSIPCVELRMIYGSLEQALVSNKRRSTLIDINITLGPTVKIDLSINRNAQVNVCDAYNALQFWQALRHGGTLSFIALDEDESWLSIPSPPQPGVALTEAKMTRLEQLCQIQQRMGRELPFPRGGCLRQPDVISVNNLFNITDRGRTITKYELITAEFDKLTLQLILQAYRLGSSFYVRRRFDESHIELLNLRIPTGTKVEFITGTPNMPQRELAELVEKVKAHERRSLQLVNAEIIELYPDWFIREAERLSKILVKKFGAETVYLFGSLAWGGNLHPETDIDLAVSGLPAKMFYKAIAVTELESNYPIHLFDLSSLPEHLQERILKEGRVLFERQPLAAVGG